MCVCVHVCLCVCARVCACALSWPVHVCVCVRACTRAQLPSHVQLFATQQTVAHWVPLSMGCPRQEYCSGLPFPSQGIIPTEGLNLRFLHQQAGSLPQSHQQTL